MPRYESHDASVNVFRYGKHEIARFGKGELPWGEIFNPLICHYNQDAFHFTRTIYDSLEPMFARAFNQQDERLNDPYKSFDACFNWLSENATGAWSWDEGIEQDDRTQTPRIGIFIERISDQLRFQEAFPNAFIYNPYGDADIKRLALQKGVIAQNANIVNSAKELDAHLGVNSLSLTFGLKPKRMTDPTNHMVSTRLGGEFCLHGNSFYEVWFQSLEQLQSFYAKFGALIEQTKTDMGTHNQEMNRAVEEYIAKLGVIMPDGVDIKLPSGLVLGDIHLENLMGQQGVLLPHAYPSSQPIPQDFMDYLHGKIEWDAVKKVELPGPVPKANAGLAPTRFDM